MLKDSPLISETLSHLGHSDEVLEKFLSSTSIRVLPTASCYSGDYYLREKIWNLNGYLFLEIENWLLENQSFRHKILFLGQENYFTEHFQAVHYGDFLSILKNFDSNDTGFDPGYTQPLIALPLSKELHRIAQNCPQFPPTSSQLTKMFDHIDREGPKEPFIAIRFYDVLQTILYYSTHEISDFHYTFLKENTRGSLIDNNLSIYVDKAGTMRLHRCLSSNLNLFNQNLTDPNNAFVDLSSVVLEQFQSIQYLPFSTFNTLILEQIPFLTWTSAIPPEDFDSDAILSMIHYTMDPQEAVTYVAKMVPANRSHDFLLPKLNEAVAGDPFSFVLAGCSQRICSYRIFDRLYKKGVTEYVLSLFKSGGLINRLLLKYAWTMGLTPIPTNFDPALKFEKFLKNT